MDINLNSKLESIARISATVESISNKSIIYAAPKQCLYFEKDKQNWIYLLTNGEVNICRLSDDLVVHTLTAPAIIGITSLFNNNYYHYISTNVDSSFLRVGKSDFTNIMDEYNCWKDVCLLVCENAQLYYKRDELVYSSKVYGVVKNHLEALWSMPEESRKNISIFSFILSRTSISRSSLNKILKDLRKGGYITLNRGKLVALMKLPSKY
ncbi:helix-turn-helix domain-containing protein [Enterobacter asburiae]|uniref:helix-turn-helix domain-containing protein n=1 Tax=Enterobacter asburiae TaxID=61645 RepID=UPI00192CDEED|nr:helix-turn-helix domain-containing protein [Enterobacter asburiae]MBL5841173.1 helix-turn-helix domain-containing protein [Enterobacter asburiae]MBL5912413.1 helix-turn-helix domain-containing protein [Enterobacter asburiae]MBL5916922.1 helix-turn-helix domain-containing protein [Enterobacter asburiae]MBL5941541.1 helix-turn-helix domain-containing protein [Enterobacter asburiae]